MTQSNLFELLERTSATLANSPNEANVAQSASENLSKIYGFQQVISKDKKLSGIFVYKCLRMLQEVDYLNITFRIEDQAPNSQFQVAVARLRTILQALFRANTDFSVCGREFLRIALDRPLIGEFMSNFMMDKFLEDSPPDPMFMHLMVPKDAQEKIESAKSKSSSMKQIASDLVARYNRLTLHFFICDCIRYIFNVPALDYQQKASLVLALLDQMPHKEAMITSFEVNLCLCLDLLTFTSKNRDRSAIKAFFEIYKQYNSLGYFIERVSKKYPSMALSVATAMKVCKTEIPSNYIKWPDVEEEAPALDTNSLLTETIDKLKWSTRDTPAVAALVNSCASQLMVNIFDKGPCELSIPVRRNEELNLVIRSENLRIIAKLCEKNAGIFRMTIYELGLAKSYVMLKNLLSDLFKSEASNTVFPALSKVLVIQPELIEPVASVIADAPENLDPSPFIRFMSYNCTADDLATLLQRPIFPKDHEQAVHLFKDSVRWRQTAQCTFWIIVRKAYASPQHHNSVVEAFGSVVKLLGETQIALNEVKFLLRTGPTPAVSKFVVELVRQGGQWQAVVVSILKSWVLLVPDAAARFTKKEATTLRQFHAGLPANLSSEFPQLIKDLL